MRHLHSLRRHSPLIQALYHWIWYLARECIAASLLVTLWQGCEEKRLPTQWIKTPTIDHLPAILTSMGNRCELKTKVGGLNSLRYNRPIKSYLKYWDILLFKENCSPYSTLEFQLITTNQHIYTSHNFASEGVAGLTTVIYKDTPTQTHMSILILVEE